MNKLRYSIVIVAVLLGATSAYGSQVGESYNDAEAELKAGDAKYVTGSFDKEHRFLNIGQGHIVVAFYKDIAIAITSRFPGPLPDAVLKALRGEGIGIRLCLGNHG